jgi:hypothetical protein
VEAFGILLYAAGGLFAAPVFCFILVRYAPRFPQLSARARDLSFALLAVFVIDLAAGYFAGAVRARAAVGPVYFPVHAAATLLAAPALACVLLTGRRSVPRWWPVVAVLAWCLGVFAIFYQYQVAEALYGIGGSGGPYS